MSNEKGTIKNPPSSPLPLISCGKVKTKVLECLNKGMNTYAISRKLGRDRSTIRQHLKELQVKGLSVKDGNTWYITKRGVSILGGGFDNVVSEREGGVSTDWLQDRGHNIKIKVAVVAKPNNRNWLSDWSVNDKMKNNIFYTSRFGEIVTTYTGKSLIFQLPVMKFKSAEIAVVEAGKIGVALIKKYEADVFGLKLGKPDIKAQVIAQHHAVPFDPFAKWMVANNLSYRDDYIDIDASETPEIEFTKSEESHIHHERYVDHVKDIIVNEVDKPSDMMARLTKLDAQIDNIFKIQEVTSKQLEVNTKLQESNIKLINNLLPKKEELKEDRLGPIDYVG